MKKILTTIAFAASSVFIFAQQDAQFSMNMYNRLSVNPGYAGMNEALCGTLFYRQQWTNFPGAPKTGLLSLDYGKIKAVRGGVGLTIGQDQLGFDKTFAAKLAYSYHQPLGPGALGIGIDIGMIQKNLSGNFVAPDGGTTQVPTGDNAIPWAGVKSTTYDLGLGLYYRTFNNKLYVGLSTLHIPGQQLKGSGSNFTFDYTVARHYYVMAGYIFNLGNMFDLTPSILTKTDAASTQLDINLLAKWNKMVFVGLSYRLSDAVVGIVGLEWKGFRFGYSYDMTTSAIKNHSNGTHEIMLGYCKKFAKPVKPHGHMNVRFL